MSSQKNKMDYKVAEKNIANNRKIKKSVNELYKMTMKGDSKACFVLGKLYLNGSKDTIADEDAADKYFEHAFSKLEIEAKKEDPAALMMLGEYYINGYKPVEKDENLGLWLLERSYLLGENDAQNIIGEYRKTHRYIEDIEDMSEQFFGSAQNTQEPEDNFEYQNIDQEDNVTRASYQERSEDDDYVEANIDDTYSENETENQNSRSFDEGDPADIIDLDSAEADEEYELQRKQNENDYNEEKYGVKEDIPTIVSLITSNPQGDYDLSKYTSYELYQIAKELDKVQNPSEPLKSQIGIIYDAAFNDIRARALENDPLYLRLLAEYFYNGYGSIDVDLAKALYFYDKSCNLGDEESTLFLYKFYSKDPQTKWKADIYEKIIKGDSGVEHTSDDPDYLYALLEKYNRKDMKIINLIHDLRKNSKNEETYLNLLREVENYAEEGSVDAMLLAGFIYSNKKEFDLINEDKAFYYFNKAQQRQSVMGSYQTGRIMMESQDEKYHNFKQGFDLISFAAKEGLVEALDYLGNLYRLGNGVTQDLKVARQFYNLACQRCYGLSFYHLYLMDKKEKKNDYANENLWLAMRNGFDISTGFNYFREAMLPPLGTEGLGEDEDEEEVDPDEDL